MTEIGLDVRTLLVYKIAEEEGETPLLWVVEPTVVGLSDVPEDKVDFMF